MKRAFIPSLVMVLAMGGLAKDNTPKNYQHATYMGLHKYVSYSEMSYLSCLSPSGCIANQLIEAAADIKDDHGVVYTMAVPSGKDPIRQFAVGDVIQFRVESKPTKQLTEQQTHNRPLVPYPDTSQNVQQCLVIILSNGKERRYSNFDSTLGHHHQIGTDRVWPTNPNEKVDAPDPAVSPVAAGNAAMDRVMNMTRQIMEHQATTMSDNVLRQMCAMDSGEHNYYQPYCDELKMREAAKK